MQGQQQSETPKWRRRPCHPEMRTSKPTRSYERIGENQKKKKRKGKACHMQDRYLTQRWALDRWQLGCQPRRRNGLYALEGRVRSTGVAGSLSWRAGSASRGSSLSLNHI